MCRRFTLSGEASIRPRYILNRPVYRCLVLRKVSLLLAASLAAYAALTVYLSVLEYGVVERSGYVSAQGVSIYFAEWTPRNASVKGTAVLLHGLGGSLEMMRWLGVELARNGYRAIAYDNAGHGRSSRAEASLNSTQAFKIYSAVLDALGVPNGEEIVLVGHSMGGFFAQEFAAMDPRVGKLFILASRPYVNATNATKVAVYAARDEIFTPTLAEGWEVVVLPYDNHLTILYNPVLIGLVLGKVVGGGYTNLSAPRLHVAVARSASAFSVMILAFYAIASLRGGKAETGHAGPRYALLLLSAIATAPLAFLMYTVTSRLVSLIAGYVLAVLYSQAVGLAAALRLRIGSAGAIQLRSKRLLRGAAAGALLAAVAYASVHEALQPFFNVELSPFRFGLFAGVLALSLPPVAVFEAAFRRELQRLPLHRGLAATVVLRLASFASAYVTARLLLGAQGVAGYLLIVTYVSLVLLLPLDAAAQVWLWRTGSWSENFLWLAVVYSVLLAAVSPLL